MLASAAADGVEDGIDTARREWADLIGEVVLVVHRSMPREVRYSALACAAPPITFGAAGERDLRGE